MIKNHLTRRTIAVFFILNFLSTIIPYNAIYANNNGPNAPEASGFEPVSATDMVNLSSGDLSYVLPLLEVDGFPVTLSYHAGIPMDMDASWIGLGWNINTGSIARGVVSTPDDWNNGKSMKFTYYKYETETYTVNVGVGFAKVADVGVGLSWGSNKSLSGSVSASVGPISASIDTDGNYSVGLNSSIVTKGLGFKAADSEGSPFGGSLSVSGNTGKEGLSVGANAGYSKNGLNAGLGISISGNGIGAGFSIGGGNGKKGGDKRSAGGGGSIGSFSAGDMSISSSGFYLPISIGIFSFGFGYQKQKIKYAKGLNRYGFGVLYQNTSTNMYNLDLGERNDNTASGLVYDDDVADLQRRNFYGDIYDQELPQSESEFIQDYKEAIEKVNFTFAGYDSYDVNASGISGNMTPLIGENVVLMGEGFEGENSQSDTYREKMKVFYHNAMKRARRLGVTPYLPVKKSLQNNNFHFAFDGQITEDVNVTAQLINSPTKNTNYFDLSDFVSNSSTYLSRPKMGSYVEVFTNEQLDTDPSNMLKPTTIHKEEGVDLRRVNDLGYIADGIGGYKITTPDGKTYHFAQPVYQYEEVEHNHIELEDAQNVDKKNSSSKRTATPYATHWLLTAITGPDYIDNGNNYPDEDDLGYWLRLDHGRWSNAYTWRSPYANVEMLGQDDSITDDRRYRSYSTFNEDNVDKSDGGHFTQGRKDLYYLDKIVSRNQIAYFVKDIRKDAIGTDLDYIFTNLNGATLHPTFNGETIRGQEWAKYEKEYSLKLDKIIITKNTTVNRIEANKSNNTPLGGISSVLKTGRYNSIGFFNTFLSGATKNHRLHQINNVIDVNDFVDFDYSNALKVIKFNHSYDLAKSTPNSEAVNRGKLTLNGVHFYGRGIKEGAKENELYDYMPPYRFSYQRPELHFSRNDSPAKYGDQLEFNKKDSWGFIEGKDNNNNTLADSWSLNQIRTPQGATIDIDYEEDDYYVEAFSRRYWDNNLRIKIKKLSNNDLELEFRNDNDKENFNFKDYFESNDKVYFDMWLSLQDQLWYGLAGWLRSRSYIDIKANQFEITGLNENFLKIRIPSNKYRAFQDGRVNRNLINDCFWRKNVPDCYRDYGYTNVSRGSYPSVGNNGRKYGLLFKLLAAKSPKDRSGGGLKVAKITINDEVGAKYETAYEYKVPGTSKSSGITSFYPVFGTTFVPYQNELPGPGVMYEWVTMTSQAYSASGLKLPSESTRYHYYTLKPNFHIFNPNFEMKDKDGEVIFGAKIKDYSPNISKVTGKNIEIEKNLAKIGQLISIEKFNSKGHLVNKTENRYTNKQGFFKETFTSMKSVYKYNYKDDGNNSEFKDRVLDARLLSLSSKKEYGKVLNKVTTVTPSGTSSIEYENPDPYLGNFRTSVRTMSNGTKTRETKIPAYDVYAEMGSKRLNHSNKNMLIQEAMNVSSVKTGKGAFDWKTINATITTWDNNHWKYRDEDGKEPLVNAEYPVWRKHKSFVWKGNLDENGTYGREITSRDFNWGYGATQTNTQWQEVSEVTRYNHFSLPLETKDINGNYIASKMRDGWSKTIAAGNARYTEMYYSGLEYTNSGNSINKEGELTFESCKPSNIAHTGEKSVALNSTASKAFIINATVGNKSTDEFRSGKYKMSVWVNKHVELGFNPVKLNVNGTEYEPKEIVSAGNWVLLNFYVDFKDGNITSYLKNTNGSVTLDDFRIHPVASSMNSYVYDKDTDELRYILDGNNLAAEFKYDKAGRLCRTYKEVVDQGTNLGGFKKVNEYRYRYKNAPTYSGECSCCEVEVPVAVNDVPIANHDSYSKNVTISNKKFTLDVLANDYDPNSFDNITINNITSNPSNGSVTIVDNKIVYTPNINFYGTDSFTYNIKDNGTPIKTSNIARVSINVIDGKLKGYIRVSDFSNTGNRFCATHTLNLSSGSGDYSYYWTLETSNGIQQVGRNASFYPCVTCVGLPKGTKVSTTVKCLVTDNVTGETLLLNTLFADICNSDLH